MFYLWNKRNFKMGKYLCEGVHRTQVNEVHTERILACSMRPKTGQHQAIVSCMAAEE